MRVEFTHGGKTYIYDPNDDGFNALQFFRARAIWEYQSQVQTEPPSTFTQMEATGATDADMRALSHLLIEIDEEGNVVKYDDAKSPARARAFLDELPGRYAKTMMECRSDFFDAAELFNVGSAKLLAGLSGALMGGASLEAMLRSAAEQQQTKRATSSSPRGSESSDSTRPESSTDDSVDETPTAPITETSSPSS